MTAEELQAILDDDSIVSVDVLPDGALRVNRAGAITDLRAQLADAQKDRERLKEWKRKANVLAGLIDPESDYQLRCHLKFRKGLRAFLLSSMRDPDNALIDAARAGEERDDAE